MDTDLGILMILYRNFTIYTSYIPIIIESHIFKTKNIHLYPSPNKEPSKIYLLIMIVVVLLLLNIIIFTKWITVEYLYFIQYMLNIYICNMYIFSIYSIYLIFTFFWKFL